jgi:predicted metal-dependent hydrolase
MDANLTQSHPMDEFPVRQLRFQFNDTHPVWSRSCPEFSMFINALGVHVPHFERFLVSTMREYRDELASESLKQDVKNIIGQEAHHAFNFVKWTEHLARRYPAISHLDQQAKDYFAAALTRNKKFKIGFTAGYETFTFLAGIIILGRYDELMRDADPSLRALWVWHQVEEVEHGAVAFEFYQAFYEDKEWYRKWMVLFAFVHISFETFKSYKDMMRVEDIPKLRGWKFFFKFAGDLAYSALPVLKRGYHPRNHPICNSEQNKIALAWREYHKQGHDVQRLEDAVMAQLNAG